MRIRLMLVMLGLIAVTSQAAGQDGGPDSADSGEEEGPPTAAETTASPEQQTRFVPKETISPESVISFPADI